MCCPRRLVLLVLTALISVTANYVGVAASSHLHAATPPAVRPLHKWRGALSDFRRRRRGTEPILGPRWRVSKRCKFHCRVQNPEGGPRGARLNRDHLRRLGDFNGRKTRFLDAFLLTCKCFGAAAWHTILSQGYSSCEKHKHPHIGLRYVRKRILNRRFLVNRAGITALLQWPPSD